LTKPVSRNSPSLKRGKSEALYKHSRSQSAVSKSELNTDLSDGIFDNKPWNVSKVISKRKTSSSNIIRDFQQNTQSISKLKNFNSNKKLKRENTFYATAKSTKQTSKDYLNRKNEDNGQLFDDEINIIENQFFNIKITSVDRSKKIDSIMRNSDRLKTIKEEFQSYETNGRILDFSFEKKLKELDEKLCKTENNFIQNYDKKESDNKANEKTKEEVQDKK